jgi:hypothetical protein
MNPQLLIEQIAEALGAVLEDGFVAPLHVACVARNGSLHYARYVLNDGGGLDLEVLSSHDENGMFVFPINVVIVDSEGDAARVVIKAIDQRVIS